MCKDLYIKQMQAHYLYVLPRFHNLETRRGFTYGFQYSFSIENNKSIPPPFRPTKNFNKGVDLAFDIDLQINKHLNDRFINGRDGEFYMEKL